MSKQFKKHSLGTLRQAVRTKDRSPNLIGQIALQRSDFIQIQQYFQQTGREEMICNLAGWFHVDWKESALLCSSRCRTSNARLLLRPSRISLRKTMRMTTAPHRHSRDPEHNLKIVKTLRLSEVLLQKIKAECAACDLKFSDFMRNAAVAGLTSRHQKPTAP